MTIEAPLPGRAQDAGEHVLGHGPARRSIAAAAHLAGDDRPANRVFRTPIRGVGREGKQEREQGVPLSIQVLHESTDGIDRGRVVQDRRQLVDQVTASDRGPVRRDLASRVTVAHRQGFMQHVVDLSGQTRARVVVTQFVRAALQVAETGLMIGVGELPIGGPPIVDQDPGERWAEETGGLVKAASRQDRIHRRGGRHTDPQPVQDRMDPPARFVRDHHRAGAHGLHEGRIGRPRFRRGAMQGADDRARRHGQAEALGEQRGDFAERHSQLLVQDRRGRDGLGAQLHRGRAERIRGLQRMPALHAPAAPATAADMHVKPADQGPDGRQIFLILGRHVRVLDGAAAVRTRARNRHVVRLIDPRRDGAVPLSSIARSRFPSRTTRICRRRALREGRRLAEAGAPGGVEVFAQPLVLAPQSLQLTFDSFQRRAQSGDVFGLLCDQVVAGGFKPIGHATVMPELWFRYKSNRGEPR